MRPAVSAQARLRILRSEPLTLRGERFRRLERVRITVTADGRTTLRKVRTGVTGRLSLAFPGLRLHRSVSELTVRAVGNRGSVATFTIHQIRRESV